MSDPTDRSECPQLRPALGDIVEVASILPVADANSRPAKDLDPRELATLPMLSRPDLRVRMKHSGVPSCVGEQRHSYPVSANGPLTTHPHWNDEIF